MCTAWTALADDNYLARAWSNGLYTERDHLFYRLVTVLVYEKERQLGMLNPLADVFIPKQQKTYTDNIENIWKCNLLVRVRKKL